jgi:hypothetical protein
VSGLPDALDSARNVLTGYHWDHSDHHPSRPVAGCPVCDSLLTLGALTTPEPVPAAEGLDVERLTTVLYDWMPDGADVSVGLDGESLHLTGGDLARYIFERAGEYARTAGEPTR